VSVFDRVRLAELFGDDRRTIAEVEREFAETAHCAWREISGSDDCTAIAAAAHRLKGAAGMVGAAGLRELAGWVEHAARARDLAGVRRAHADFVRELRRMDSAIAPDV
jgi:HPt (histidine-containing phosphotransfer) domain-containing protein